MTFVVNPLTDTTAVAVDPVARPETLDGGTLGVHINGKEFSEVVLRRIASELAQRYNFKEILWWNKRFPATASPYIEEMAGRCSFVLNGVGH
jgi:hypothetical protein